MLINNLLKLSIAASVALLSACAVVDTKNQEAGIKVTALAFYNGAKSTLYDVKLRNPTNNNLVGCQLVEVDQHCGTGFPAAYYRGAEFEVRWFDNAGVLNQQSITFTLPQNISEDKAYVAVVKFESASVISAFLTENPRVF